MNSRLRILYVDDSKHDRELVRESLAQEENAFELVEASSRTAFLRLLADGPYDLVLSDFNILGFEGLQVFDAVKARDKRTPVVIITGTGTEEIAAEAMRRGVSDYVIKTTHHIRHLPFTLRSAIHQARLKEEYQRSLDALRDSEQRLRLALWASRQGLFDLDITTQTAKLTLEPESPSSAAHQLTPMGYGELRRRIHPPDRARVWRAYREHVDNRTPELRVEFRVRASNGESRWMLAMGMAVHTSGLEPPSHILGIFSDITSQKARDEQLLLAASVFENSREIIVIVDAEQRIVSANQACCDLTGHRIEELWGKDIQLLRSARHDQAFFLLLNERLRAVGYWQGELWARRMNGEEFPTLEVISQVSNARGDITHYIHIATDVTKEKEADERMRRLAFFDALTGLPNRAVFADRVEQALYSSSRQRTDVVLMFIDLDRFKQVNDTLGHLVGDALLCEVARRMELAVREMDTICRLGGDEFLILLPKGGDRAAVRVAEKLRDLVCRPFTTAEGTTIQVSCSIGISLAPRDGVDYETLLANADTALYQAKAAGRNTYMFFGSEMNTEASERLTLEHDMQVALNLEQFGMLYQPLIDMKSERIVGMEALLRWRHPTLGELLPPEFMHTAEESSLAAQIDTWVIGEVCRQLEVWMTTGLAPVPVSINLTSRLFVEGALLPTLDAAMAAHHVPASLIAIELTETTLTHSVSAARNVLPALKERGIAIALDNFGTGNSSLHHLRRLPLDTLKIDISLVADMGAGPNEQALAASVIKLGQALGLKVLAEGVETEQQRAILAELSCDQMQGHVHSHPMQAEEIARLLLTTKP
ncbi:MAG: EAL domain-containing protein [Burkholderiales bacterium]|nr:EAL domain-containing protein [Burkholderiales bacterium]